MRQPGQHRQPEPASGAVTPDVTLRATTVAHAGVAALGLVLHDAAVVTAAGEVHLLLKAIVLTGRFRRLQSYDSAKSVNHPIELVGSRFQTHLSTPSRASP